MLAKRLAETDPEAVIGWLYFKKCGKLPREFQDYDLNTLQAYLGYLEDAIQFSALRRQVADAERVDQEPRGTIGESWAEPLYTGDPVVDEWERQIAAGEDPDLDAEP